MLISNSDGVGLLNDTNIINIAFVSQVKVLNSKWLILLSQFTCCESMFISS